MPDYPVLSNPIQADLKAIALDAPQLNKLSPRQSLRLTAAGTVKRLPEGTQLVRQGSPIEEVGIVLRGMVGTRLDEGLAAPISLYVSGSGTIVDASALLDPPLSAVSVRALSQVEMLALPRSAFVELLSEEPAVGYRIFKNLFKRLSLINELTFDQLTLGDVTDLRN